MEDYPAIPALGVNFNQHFPVNSTEVSIQLLSPGGWPVHTRGTKLGATTIITRIARELFGTTQTGIAEPPITLEGTQVTIDHRLEDESLGANRGNLFRKRTTRQKQLALRTKHRFDLSHLRDQGRLSRKVMKRHVAN